MKLIYSLLALTALVGLIVVLYPQNVDKKAPVDNNRLIEAAITESSQTKAETFRPRGTPNRLVDPQKPVEGPIEPLEKGLSLTDLRKMIGANKSTEWQTEYDQNIYEPGYDLTWQDDMYSHAFELIVDERYSSSVQINEMSCKEDVCNLSLTEVPGNHRPLKRVVADLMLDLKTHPAILKSGKRRNVYLNQINYNESANAINFSIH